MPPAMILFALTGQIPPILLLTLVVMCFLTAMELRKEEDLQLTVKLWWVLLVALLNVLGFAIFWIWLATRRRRHSTA
jgi:uncharacterized BrkB/YihY/UPF0761 family membrane protein